MTRKHWSVILAGLVVWLAPDLATAAPQTKYVDGSYPLDSNQWNVTGTTTGYLSGSNTTLVLGTEMGDEDDDCYNGYGIYIASGTGIGQSRTITDYSLADNTVTVSVAWTTEPVGATYVITTGKDTGAGTDSDPYGTLAYAITQTSSDANSKIYLKPATYWGHNASYSGSFRANLTHEWLRWGDTGTVVIAGTNNRQVIMMDSAATLKLTNVTVRSATIADPVNYKGLIQVYHASANLTMTNVTMDTTAHPGGASPQAVECLWYASTSASTRATTATNCTLTSGRQVILGTDIGSLTLANCIATSTSNTNSAIGIYQALNNQTTNLTVSGGSVTSGFHGFAFSRTASTTGTVVNAMFDGVAFTTGGGTTPYAIYVATDATTTVPQVRNLTVRNCTFTFSAVGGSGIRVARYARKVVIDNNTFQAGTGVTAWDGYAIYLGREIRSTDVTGCGWTNATSRVTKTGGFTNYTWASGDRCLVYAGTGVTKGEYEVASRVSADAISLTADINGAGGDISDASVSVDICPTGNQEETDPLGYGATITRNTAVISSTKTTGTSGHLVFIGNGANGCEMSFNKWSVNNWGYCCVVKASYASIHHNIMWGTNPLYIGTHAEACRITNNTLYSTYGNTLILMSRRYGCNFYDTIGCTVTHNILACFDTHPSGPPDQRPYYVPLKEEALNTVKSNTGAGTTEYESFNYIDSNVYVTGPGCTNIASIKGVYIAPTAGADPLADLKAAWAAYDPGDGTVIGAPYKYNDGNSQYASPQFLSVAAADFRTRLTSPARLDRDWFNVSVGAWQRGEMVGRQPFWNLAAPYER